MGRQRILCVVTVVAALVAATPAMAQRLSLGERVTRLENQANVENQTAGQANLEQQNRLVQLQAEVQSLRNVVETLQNEIEQALQVVQRLGRQANGAARHERARAACSLAARRSTAPSALT